MRNVLVTFEVSVSQSEEPFLACKPDYSFSGEFDKDDKKSFSKMCDLEYKVHNLVNAFMALGCKVIALRKEISHLDF